MKKFQVSLPTGEIVCRVSFWPRRCAERRAARMTKIFNEIDIAPLEQIADYCRPIWVGHFQRGADQATTDGNYLVNQIAHQYQSWAQHAVNNLICKLRWVPEMEWSPPLEWSLLALLVPHKGSALYGTDFLSRLAMQFIDYLFDREEARAAIFRIDHRLGQQINAHVS